MSKKVNLSDSARNSMVEGVNILAEAVGATMGPGGRLAALCRDFGPVMMTKDGVTVAREIELEDKLQEAGARLCRQVANKCNEQAGDGTTTATVLAQEMINLGMKYLSSGGNPVHLKKGIDKAIKHVVQYLDRIKIPITLSDEHLVRFVAEISGNSPEVGAVVAEAFIKAGQYGVVTYEEGKTAETTIETVDGTQFDRGYISPYFVTDQVRDQTVMENPLILLWERKLMGFQEIATFLQRLQPLQRPILIISDGVEGDALATLVINQMRGNMSLAAVTAPAFGEQRQLLMGDLACLVKGRYFAEASGHKLENVDPSELGTAHRVIITKNSTTIIGGAGSDSPEFEQRLESIRKQAKETDSQYDRDKLEQRLAKLGGGVVVIKMGAHNEIEMREKKFRYEDAVHATRAALEEGIVPGGGTAFIGALPTLSKLSKSDTEGETMGVKIVMDALTAPCKKIAVNAGYSGDNVIEHVREGLRKKRSSTWGFNAGTGKYGDMLKLGIVDPAKVSRLALENSATIAGLCLLTEVLITENPEDKAQPQYGGGMM